MQTNRVRPACYKIARLLFAQRGIFLACTLAAVNFIKI